MWHATPVWKIFRMVMSLAYKGLTHWLLGSQIPLGLVQDPSASGKQCVKHNKLDTFKIPDTTWASDIVWSAYKLCKRHFKDLQKLHSKGHLDIIFDCL